MLADAFARKLRAKYIAEGKAQGIAEVKAKAEAMGEAKVLAAFEQAATRQGKDPEVIRRIVQDAREILRNRRA